MPTFSKGIFVGISSATNFSWVKKEKGETVTLSRSCTLYLSVALVFLSPFFFVTLSRSCTLYLSVAIVFLSPFSVT